MNTSSSSLAMDNSLDSKYYSSLTYIDDFYSAVIQKNPDSIIKLNLKYLQTLEVYIKGIEYILTHKEEQKNTSIVEADYLSIYDKITSLVRIDPDNDKVNIPCCKCLYYSSKPRNLIGRYSRFHKEHKFTKSERNSGWNRRGRINIILSELPLHVKKIRDYIFISDTFDITIWMQIWYYVLCLLSYQICPRFRDYEELLEYYFDDDTKNITLVPMPNCTGYFRYGQYLHAFKLDMYIVDVPIKPTIADQLLYTPIGMFRHDLNHTIGVYDIRHRKSKISNSIGTLTNKYTELDALEYMLSDTTISTRERELLIFTLWYLIHEDETGL